MDHQSLGALYYVAFYVPVTTVAKIASASRFLAELFADKTPAWSALYYQHFCGTEEQIKLIVPTDGSFWASGRFKSAFVEQYFLQYLRYNTFESDSSNNNIYKIFHRTIREEADFERWIRVEEDDILGFVGSKSMPVSFAYHQTNAKSAESRQKAKLKFQASQRSKSEVSSFIEGLDSIKPLSTQQLASAAEWIRESADKFVEAFSRSLAMDIPNQYDLDDFEWIEISFEFALRAMKRLQPSAKTWTCALNFLIQLADSSAPRCFIGLLASESSIEMIGVAVVTNTRCVYQISSTALSSDDLAALLR